LSEAYHIAIGNNNVETAVRDYVTVAVKMPLLLHTICT